MKTLICFTLFFFTYALAPASDSVTIERAKAYLKENNSKSCEFAVGVTAPSSKQVGKNDESKILANYIYCFYYVITGEGTINKKEGCGLSFLSLNTGKTRSPSRDVWGSQLGWGGTSDPPIAKGKKCKDGGFEAVLKIGLGFPNYKSVQAVSSGRVSLVNAYPAKTIALYDEGGFEDKFINAGGRLSLSKKNSKDAK